MADKKKNLGIRVDESQHLFLKTLALKTNRSVQRLIEEAIRNAYDDGRMPSPPSVRPRHLQAHALLEEILESGDQKAIDWITGNLQMFAEALKARAIPSPPIRKHGA